MSAEDYINFDACIDEWNDGTSNEYGGGPISRLTRPVTSKQSLAKVVRDEQKRALYKMLYGGTITGRTSSTMPRMSEGLASMSGVFGQARPKPEGGVVKIDLGLAERRIVAHHVKSIEEFNRRKNMRNKDYIWQSADGRAYALHEMEESHLMNTVAFLDRKINEFNNIATDAADKGLLFPKYKVNGELGTVWKDRMLKELNRRVSKEIKAAEDLLAANKRG